MTTTCFMGQHASCNGCECSCHKRSLFEKGAAARDDAMQRVEAHAPDGWTDRARAYVKNVAKRLPELATDDVWLSGLDAPPQPRALGPVMTYAVEHGWLEELDETRLSRLPRQHRRPLRMYRSRICEVA